MGICSVDRDHLQEKGGNWDPEFTSIRCGKPDATRLARLDSDRAEPSVLVLSIMSTAIWACLHTRIALIIRLLR
jgi:hypothetical protein